MYTCICIYIYCIYILYIYIYCIYIVYIYCIYIYCIYIVYIYIVYIYIVYIYIVYIYCINIYICTVCTLPYLIYIVCVYVYTICIVSIWYTRYTQYKDSPNSQKSARIRFHPALKGSLTSAHIPQLTHRCWCTAPELADMVLLWNLGEGMENINLLRFIKIHCLVSGFNAPEEY